MRWRNAATCRRRDELLTNDILQLTESVDPAFFGAGEVHRQISMRPGRGMTYQAAATCGSRQCAVTSGSSARAALVITRAVGSGRWARHPALRRGRAAAGASPALKIWGVLTVLVVVGGITYRRGLRPGLTVLISAVASRTVICLPFFLAAPGRMWTMVVAPHCSSHMPRCSLLRQCGFSTTPAPAAPLVLVLGGGLAIALIKVGTIRISWLPPALATLAVIAAMLSALPLTQLRLGRTFPVRAAAAAVADLPGCVVTDFPMALIQMNLLRHHPARSCRYEVI